MGGLEAERDRSARGGPAVVVSSLASPRATQWAKFKPSQPKSMIQSSPLPDPADTAGPAPSQAARQWLSAELLSADLKQRIAIATAAAGLEPAALCEQWLREGLERLEAQQAAAADTAANASDEDDDAAGAGSGRCSLRTGSRSAGPVPLPVQQ